MIATTAAVWWITFQWHSRSGNSDFTSGGWGTNLNYGNHCQQPSTTELLAHSPPAAGKGTGRV